MDSIVALFTHLYYGLQSNHFLLLQFLSCDRTSKFWNLCTGPKLASSMQIGRYERLNYLNLSIAK